MAAESVDAFWAKTPGEPDNFAAVEGLETGVTVTIVDLLVTTVANVTSSDVPDAVGVMAAQGDGTVFVVLTTTDVVEGGRQVSDKECPSDTVGFMAAKGAGTVFVILTTTDVVEGGRQVSDKECPS